MKDDGGFPVATKVNAAFHMPANKSPNCLEICINISPVINMYLKFIGKKFGWKISG
jgi:hypothetical protein